MIKRLYKSYHRYTNAQGILERHGSVYLPKLLDFHTYYRVDALRSLISENVRGQHVKFEAIAKDVKFFYMSSHASVDEASTGVPSLVAWIVNKRKSKAREIVNITNNLHAIFQRDVDSDVLPERMKGFMQGFMVEREVKEIDVRNEDMQIPKDDTPPMLTLADALTKADMIVRAVSR